MSFDPKEADVTEGDWSVSGNKYTEGVDQMYTYEIILLDVQNFIYANDKTTFYERRPGAGGLPFGTITRSALESRVATNR